MKYEYVLLMLPPNCDGDDPVQEIAMTRVEHGLLEKHLASIRKLKPAAPARKPVPAWMETPDCDFGLEVWNAYGCLREIDVTREEFMSLKRHLASMRAANRAA
jgi:hypothetical protein